MMFKCGIHPCKEGFEGTVCPFCVESVERCPRCQGPVRDHRCDICAAERLALTVDDPGVIGDDLMNEAWRLTNGDRHQSYGRAEDVFRAYGLIWTGLLAHKLAPGAVISAEDVALLMTGLKLARDTARPKRDNIVDAHGYLSLLARIRGWIRGGA